MHTHVPDMPTFSLIFSMVSFAALASFLAVRSSASSSRICLSLSVAAHDPCLGQPREATADQRQSLAPTCGDTRTSRMWVVHL